MFNRCMFLAHIRSHSQTLKNLDMSCLSVEPLPKDLIKFGLDDDTNASSTFFTITMPGSSAIPTCTSNVAATSTTVGVSEPNKDVSANCSTTRSDINNAHITETNYGITAQRPYAKIISTVPKLVPSTMHHASKDLLINLINDDDDSSSINNADSIASESHDMAVDTVNKDIDKPTDDAMEIAVSSISPDDIAERQYNALVEASKMTMSQNELKFQSSQVKGRRKCPECGFNIKAKISLRKHLQNSPAPLSENLKCDVCQLILQSSCALKMHLRIHLKIKPFRCPECAIEFHIYDRFIMHLKFTCCHMAKVVKYVCTACNSVQQNTAGLEEHMLAQHIRSIFKCGGCPVAFYNSKSVERHKQKVHPGRIIPTHSYQQCKLCPERLIPKRKFLIHIRKHMSDEKVRIYVFQCPTCKSTFFQRTELIYHRMKCDTRDGIIRYVLKDDAPHELNVNNLIASQNVEDEQEIELPKKMRKVCDETELTQDENEGVEEEEDPLSLVGFQAKEEILQEPRVETCVVCKTETVLILPGKNRSSQSMCCKKCVSPCGIPKKSDPVQRSKLLAAKLKGYKCKICNSANYMDLKSIFEHFKHFHKEFEGQSINEWLIIDNSIANIKKSATVTTAETIKEKYKKKRISSFSSLIPQGIHVAGFDATNNHRQSIPSEKKKLKRHVKTKPKIVEVKSFASGQVIVCEDVNNKLQFSCSKCEFISSRKEDFQDHITNHRTDPSAIQCLECGECFVVLPSLEKHLIINHSITDVDKYIEDNKMCMPLSNCEEFMNDTESNIVCRVCHEIFESKTVLDKHFRSHGMAFLFKKASH